MAVTIPLVFTPTIDEEYVYNRPVHEDSLRKMAQNINLLGEMAKIGSIRQIQLNQIGVPAPDPTIWQLCDGEEITSPTSPLRTMGMVQRFTPDLRGRFVRGATNAISNSFGGSDAAATSHAHGGSTGNVGGTIKGEEGDEKAARKDHNHNIESNLNDSPNNPTHQILAFYLKIN